MALWNEVDGQTKLITAANFCQNGKYAVIGTYDGRCIFYDTEVSPWDPSFQPPEATADPVAFPFSVSRGARETSLLLPCFSLAPQVSYSDPRALDQRTESSGEEDHGDRAPAG